MDFLNKIKKVAFTFLFASSLFARQDTFAEIPEYTADSIFNGQSILLPAKFSGHLLGYNSYLPQDFDEIVFTVLNPMPVSYKINVYSVSNPDAKINIVISELNKLTGVSTGKLPVVLDSKGIAGAYTASYTFSNQYKYKISITIDPLLNEENCKYYYSSQSKYLVEITPEARLTANVKFFGNASDETIKIMPQEISYAPELTYSTFPNATRDGYKLTAWYTDPINGMEITNGMNVCIGYDKLYARWEIIPQLRIIFNSNGGEGNMDDLVIPNDEKRILKENSFTRAGYTFKGWASNPDATEIEYKDKEFYQVTGLRGHEEQTLYAVWEKNPVKITFDANGGTGEMTLQEIPYNDFKILNKNTYEREGYNFKGWALSSSATEPIFMDQQFCYGRDLTTGESVTLYAVWEKNNDDEPPVILGNANIRFNANGGTGEMAAQIFPLSETTTLNKNTFVRDCHEFSGWALEANGETIYSDQQEVSGKDLPNGGAVILYAVWERVAVRISFNSNLGIGSMADQILYLTETKNLTKNTFTRDGYDFIGWALSADSNQKAYDDEAECMGQDMTTRDKVTLYALWEEKSITIKFHGNGSTGSMSDQIILYSEEVPLRENTFEREGFEFEGWIKQADSTTVDFEDQELCKGKDLISEVQVLNLYAKWKKVGDKVVVSFHPNFDTQQIMVSQEVPLNSPFYIKENIFIRDDYEFLGWARTPDAKEPEFGDKALVSVSDLSEATELTLYAVWRSLYLIIKFDKNGGIGEMADLRISRDVKSVSIGKNVFEKIGYKFIGWSKTPNGGVDYTKDDILWLEEFQSVETLTLYAKWEVLVAIEGDANAIIRGDAINGFVIKPSDSIENVVVVIAEGFDANKVTVEVGSSVISLVTNGAKFKIVSNGYDITEYLSIPSEGSAIYPNEAVVKDEYVKEVLDPNKGAIIHLNATLPILTTAATRPGLVYTLQEGALLNGMKDGASTVGDGQPWVPEITVKGGSSAFYSIKVKK